MPIHHWPIADQPREKILTNDCQSLTDAELLAILINTGYRGVSALDLAKQLLQQHEGLIGVYRYLRAAKHASIGLGRAKLAMILAAAELGRRLMSHEAGGEDQVLNNCAKSKAFLALRLQPHSNEVFACLFLDTRLRLLKYEEIFHGTINEACVYPREIIRRALFINAAKIILAHNHPSGNPQPSFADIELTKIVKRALSLVDIELIDHIIIGHKDHYSFAESALLTS